MPVRNRVWDTMNGPGFQYWESEFPDTAGNLYPGPGTFGVDTSDFCVVSELDDAGFEEAQLHNLEHGPVGLWQFDGDLLDSSPTGENLIVGAGTERYGQGAVPGTRAFYFDRDTLVRGSATANVALRILGNVTLEFLMHPLLLDNETFGDHIVGCQGVPDNSAAEADNFLWHFGFSRITGSSGINYPTWLWEGPASTFSFVEDTDFAVEPGRWHHVACTRINGGAGATTGRIYLNGTLISEDTTLDEPSGGSTARIKMGDSDSGAGLGGFRGLLQSVKVVPAALTDAQILAEARRTLPPSVRP